MMENKKITIQNSLSPLIEIAVELVYNPAGYQLTHLKLHNESVEYGACSFKLNHLNIEHRVSKITPTKTGQFVTIWKRNNKGETEPFHMADPFDFIIITSKKNNQMGVFIFPKSILVEKGIVSQNGKDGKRGIRVYPIWDHPTNQQSIKTQSWQKEYFLTIKNSPSGNQALANKLLFSEV